MTDSAVGTRKSPRHEADQSGAEALKAFSTGGHTVYQMRCGRLGTDTGPAIMAAAFDGAVLCHAPSWKLLWKNCDGDGFPLDLEVTDLDGDGRDEAPVALRDAASRLPVRVHGEVAWAVVRLDAAHVRVTLIDPGYTDPADRSARIVLQHFDGLECRDILTNEKLPINDRSVALLVPAGTLRVVDIRHR